MQRALLGFSAATITTKIVKWGTSDKTFTPPSPINCCYPIQEQWLSLCVNERHEGPGSSLPSSQVLVNIGPKRSLGTIVSITRDTLGQWANLWSKIQLRFNLNPNYRNKLKYIQNTNIRQGSGDELRWSLLDINTFRSWSKRKIM